VLTAEAEYATDLADLAERDGSPLCRPALLEKVASFLRCTTAPGVTGDDPVTGHYLQTAPLPPPARRPRARPCRQPTRGADRRAGARRCRDDLQPALAYTRASHLDVADLVARPGAEPEVARPFLELEAACGPALAGEIVGELGWRRANLGLTTQRYVGASVDESLPFLFAPEEAPLIDVSPRARREFERLVVTAHGGSAHRNTAALSQTR